ncbi:hypothetical protein LW135_07105 [Helicobacter sp. faydin-H20]|uniref:hypothetical protein n=1 Tax=Helicobacter anatolicus TaxID=2905874 RepID=UPI001E48D924|nr:hypothetical protein [Helicobacter anatolicus]MCE3037589.1 hypothetical protein [Helicobacter anatolicus]
MLGKRIAKIILIIGAGVICALFILFTYVSTKVKNEFEAQLNVFFNMGQRGDGFYFEIPKPFSCSGFFSYECKVPVLKIMLQQEKQAEIDNFTMGFRDIRINSLQRYMRGNIKTLEIAQNISPEFIPHSFEYISKDSVVDRHSGEVFSHSVFKTIGNNADAEIQTNLKLKSKKFSNKNIINIFKDLFEHNMDMDVFVEKLEFDLQKTSFKLVSKNIKEAMLSVLKQERQIHEDEYEKTINEGADNIRFLMGLFGVFDGPYGEQVMSAIGAYVDLLKGRIKSVEVGLNAKEEDQYFKAKRVFLHPNPNDIQRIFAKIFNYYDLSVEVEE